MHEWNEDSPYRRLQLYRRFIFHCDYVVIKFLNNIIFYDEPPFYIIDSEVKY